MERKSELYQMVYDILLIQIQSGTYRCSESLPTIEETSAQFQVSVDTARSAYLRLKQEGCISLSKNVGAKVLVQRDEQEQSRQVQTFFALRKDAMLDLEKSLRPLFGRAQWVGLMNATPQTLAQMEKLSQEKPRAPYAIWQCLEQKYAALGNGLLIRLARQVYMFFHAPFFSIGSSLDYLKNGERYERDLFTLCTHEDWPAVLQMVTSFQDALSEAARRFCEEQITAAPPKEGISFSWDSFRKSSQLCYSLAMQLLFAINRGVYPVGSLLPSQQELAAQKGVSVSTVRRALGLLGDIGAVTSAQYVGTLVLPPDKSTENSDFTNPVLRRRLADMVESFQIFALSCRDVSMLTLSSLGPASLEELCAELKTAERRKCYETPAYTVLRLLARFAPYQAIRTVYTELLRQFFWAYAFRGLKGSRKKVNAVSVPALMTASLEQRDFSRFSGKLEALMIDELCETAGHMRRLGIPQSVLLPTKPIW